MWIHAYLRYRRCCLHRCPSALGLSFFGMWKRLSMLNVKKITLQWLIPIHIFRLIACDEKLLLFHLICPFVHSNSVRCFGILFTNSLFVIIPFQLKSHDFIMPQTFRTPIINSMHSGDAFHHYLVSARARSYNSKWWRTARHRVMINCIDTLEVDIAQLQMVWNGLFLQTTSTPSQCVCIRIKSTL